MLIYSICYYYGKNKVSNLLNHLHSFKALEENDKKFIIVVMMDDINLQNEIYDEFNSMILEHDINFDIIVNYNWGGTILGLWLVYKYIESTYDENTFVCMFEEDYGPQDTRWFDTALNLLTDDLKYVGETTTGLIKRDNDDGRLVGKQHKNGHMFGNEVWSDGGFYFTTLEKLIIIENKIGIFHKGNPEIKYSNQIDGINYGEVGFPTQLVNAGLTFDVLKRDDYFINEW